MSIARAIGDYPHLFEPSMVSGTALIQRRTTPSNHARREFNTFFDGVSPMPLRMLVLSGVEGLCLPILWGITSTGSPLRLLPIPPYQAASGLTADSIPFSLAPAPGVNSRPS